MTPRRLQARVKNGRLVLDEPTDLGEGEVVYLQILDVADHGDDLDEEERARLHEALREGIDQMKAGQTLDAAEALADLRAHR